MEPGLKGRTAVISSESMEEITDTVVFLASDRAHYINGTEIPVDGGYSVNAR